MSDDKYFEFGGRQLVLVTCGTCSATHAIPRVMYDYYWREGGFWHCPNGHKWGWSQSNSERERQRQERELLKQRVAQQADEIADKAKAIDKLERKIKRHKTRTAAGVCPCCNRSFAKLRMHIASKHPDYVPALKAVS